MDVRKYAALNNVLVDKVSDIWFIIGYISPNGKYHSVTRMNWKRIGKKDETAIRGIDKFKASLNE